MTVFELGILMHYYCRVDDHEACNRNVPIWRETCNRFLADRVLEHALPPIGEACYVITERGRAFVEALQRVPLPEACWRVRWPDEAAPTL